MGVQAVLGARWLDARPDEAPQGARLRRRAQEWTGDDADAIGLIKMGAALGIGFLAIFTIFDIRRIGFATSAAGYHALALSGACLFLGVTWTRPFHRIWKFWTLLFCTFLMAMFVAISALTHDPESRFIAIILCPLATASFINWGPKWQVALNSVSIVTFTIAESAVPIPGHFNFYRWMGLVAALAFAQCTAIFLERYRRKIAAQMDKLDAAARFRDQQIATMAHDIRSPVAALAGYANLLAEESEPLGGQRELLDRIGSTAWNMGLAVGNVLDLYRYEEDGGFFPIAEPRDPNAIVAQAVEDCAIQASRRGRKIDCAMDRLPWLTVDCHHLDSIVRNLVACVLDCADASPIRLTARVNRARVVLAVETPRGASMPKFIDALQNEQARSHRPQGARAIGWFLLGAMAKASGGRMLTRTVDSGGFLIAVEIPCPPPLMPQR